MAPSGSSLTEEIAPRCPRRHRAMAQCYSDSLRRKATTRKERVASQEAANGKARRELGGSARAPASSNVEAPHASAHMRACRAERRSSSNEKGGYPCRYPKASRAMRDPRDALCPHARR